MKSLLNKYEILLDARVEAKQVAEAKQTNQDSFEVVQIWHPF